MLLTLLQEIETSLEADRKTVEKITESRNIAERRLQSLQTELEEVNNYLSSVRQLIYFP